VDIAFVGAGSIATKHLDHLEESDRGNVVAVCDVDEGAARRGARPHGAEEFTDWSTLFDEADFDAVVVAVPPFAHEGQELRAAEEGIDLMVEKPLALDLGYARGVAETVADAGIITQVGHHLRYQENVQRARELIDDRTIATIYGRWVSSIPGDEGHWWRSRDRSGGQVIEQPTHIFDLVRYFGGDVERVAVEGDLRVRTDELDFPDAVSATLRHEDGLPSHVMTSSASPGRDIGATVVGDGFHLDLRDNVCEGVVDGEEVHFEGDNDGHHTEIDAFVRAVAEDDPSLCRSPYADALETFAVTLAVTEAVDEERNVEVAL